MSAVKAAQQMIDGFAAGDLEAALRGLDPDVDLIYSDAVPWSGVHRGHPGFQESIGRMLERFEVEILNYELFDAGDVATSRILCKWTLRATGESFEMPVVELYWARDDKLYRIEPYYFNQKLVAETYAKSTEV